MFLVILRLKQIMLLMGLIGYVKGNPVTTMTRQNNDLPDSPDEPLNLVTRDQWGALPSNDTRPLSPRVPYVVIHHTYIPGACYNQSACAQAMRGMQRYHASLDWGDIGYNFCVGSDGAAYEGRGWHVVGIHAGQMNSISVGICLIGDWRTEIPPNKQLETTKALIAAGVASGIIAEEYRLIGHNQAMPTECPGTALHREIAKWNHFYNGTVGGSLKKV